MRKGPKLKRKTSAASAATNIGDFLHHKRRWCVQRQLNSLTGLGVAPMGHEADKSEHHEPERTGRTMSACEPPAGTMKDQGCSCNKAVPQCLWPAQGVKAKRLQGHVTIT